MKFRSFNNGTIKGVLDLLATMYLRLGKIDQSKTKQQQQRKELNKCVTAFMSLYK